MPYQPYPLTALPDPLQEYVQAVANAMKTDPACVALAALTTCAAAIGTTRAVQLKRRWREHPLLWAVGVAEQGSGKSPPIREAIRPLAQRQQYEMAQQARAIEQYEDENDAYQAQRRRARKGESSLSIAKPDRPVAKRHLVSDTTIEALAPILEENPRGVLFDGDELAGWFGQMDRYAQTKQGDAAQWRRIFDSHAITIDRKKDRETIHVARPAVSIIGTIQPEILKRVLSPEHQESGLAARLLVACPPVAPRQWSEDDIPEDIEKAYEAVVAGLLNLNHDVQADPPPAPADVVLTLPARKRFGEWFDSNEAERAELQGVLAGHWSKLVAYCARFALVFALIRQVIDHGDNESISVEDVEAAITLVEWHKGEARRVHGMLNEDEDARERRRLAQIIQAHAGEVSVRDWQRKRSHGSADAAKAELDELALAGYGVLETPPQRGRGAPKSPRFRLHAIADTDEKGAGDPE